MYDKQTVARLCSEYDSFYLYDEKQIISYAQQLKRDFEGVEFLYSVKCNPAPAVVKSIFAQGFGADAASFAEAELSHKLGVAPEKIQFSAPGKSTKDIERALDISTIIADSINEILKIQDAAAAKGMVAEIGIRVNPNFTFAGIGGVPSKFGIDEQQVFDRIDEWKALPNIKIIGIHIHSRSQELDANILERYYENVLDVTKRIQQAIGYKLKFVNMGSGLGIPYASKDQPLNTSYLGKRAADLISKLKGEFADIKIIIETGRFLVGKSGYYVTKVLDRKESMGTTFIILANTLNGFIRPSIAQLVKSYAGDSTPAACEPLFTCNDAFQFVPLTESSEQEKVTLVGNLCTAADVVAKDITLPKMDVGDIVLITNAGSYAAVLSPMQFSSLEKPVQLLLGCDGKVSDATML